MASESRERAHSFLVKLKKQNKKRVELFTLRKNHPGGPFTASYLIFPLNSDIFLTNCAIKSFADLGYEI